MSLEETLLDLFTQTVGLEPYTETDGYGRPDWGARQNYQARVVNKQHEHRTHEGDVQIAKSIVYIAGISGVSAKSRIFLPDGTTQVVLEVRRYPDDTGDVYEELICG